MLHFAIQLSHALTPHEYSVCNAQHKIHVDTHEIDCSLYHFQINYNSIVFSSNFTIAENVSTEEKIYATEDQNASAKLHHKSPRGPPILLL